jgi:hypothetical protein
MQLLWAEEIELLEFPTETKDQAEIKMDSLI